jgi:hypothetical protein
MEHQKHELINNVAVTMFDKDRNGAKVNKKDHAHTWTNLEKNSQLLAASSKIEELFFNKFSFLHLIMPDIITYLNSDP